MPIKSLEHAIRIQRKRIRNGKPGYSVAVRRYLKNGLYVGNIKNLSKNPGTKEDYETYLCRKAILPRISLVNEPPIDITTAHHFARLDELDPVYYLEVYIPTYARI